MANFLNGGIVLNIYTLFLALLLLVFQENDRKSKSNKAFIKLVLALISLVLVSVIGDFANEAGGKWIALAEASTFFVFAFDPFGFLFSLSYIDSYTVYGDKKKREFFVWLFRGYAVLNLVLVTVSQIFGLNWYYYYVDGMYHRGAFYIVRGLFHVVLCVSVLLFVFMFKECIIDTYKVPIMAFPLIVGIGGLLQVTLFNINIEYAATVFACLILLIYVQRRDVNLDYLTGTVNRRGIDMAMKRAILESKEKEFAAIMIDVDYFKTINDNFGHKAGDEVLECIADVLRSSFEKNDIVGRFGGDEFCIITRTNDENELNRKIDNIKDSVACIDWSNKGKIDLSISAGVAVYDYGSGMKVKDFLETIDRRMYEEKMEHHLSDRRHLGCI